ncbi:MAG: NfeD family protein [Candidatus Latescibacterota bacterium]|nr:NfeD family protein [Candidatus Latescibacterota bacterium]
MRYFNYMALLLLLAGGAQAQTVYHVNVKLEGMIDPGVAAFIERVVLEADEAGVDAIVFEIDTFGGRVDAATVIRDAILDAEALTIAFINKRAISAGALISLACDKIVMTQASTMGATTPVDGSGTKASDKVTSYMRAEMRATAERTGRNVKIAEAMVDERIDVPGLSVEAGRPATLTTEQALNYEMADETAETMIEMLKIYDLGDAEIVEIELNWAEHILRLLTHQIVTSLLLAVAMFGLIAEVRTPGWGLGGTLALVALGIFFGSHLIVRLAEWQELVLFAAGLALLIIELIAIPGFGLVGLAGIAAMLASVIITQLGDFQLWTIDEIAAKVAMLAISMIGAFVLSVVVLRSLPRFAAFKHLVLSNEIKASEGYTSSSRDADDELIGKEGVTVSYLRPSGIAMFEGQRLNVITDGEFIEAQRPIKIVEARGSRVVVRTL